MAFAAIASQIALFIMSMLEVASSFENLTIHMIIALVLSAAVLAASAFFGIYYPAKRHKIEKRYGKDEIDY